MLAATSFPSASVAFLLPGAPGVRVVLDGGNPEELQEKITVGVGETGAERLRCVSLLADHDPRDVDTLFRVVVVHPGVGHLTLGQDFCVLLVINLAATLIRFGLHV